MAVLAHERPALGRPQIVASLLGQIEERRRRVYVLRAAGVRAAGLRELKDELRRLREELAAAVSPAAGRAR